MIRRYLREHLPLAGLLALFAGTFALVLSLYHLPTEPVAYASALCAVMGLIALIWGFVRYRRAHQARAHVLNAPHLLLDELPSPRTLSEADDQAIMQRLLHDIRAAQSDLAAYRQDSTDYFTAWVHQIKTPLSVMRLQLQSEDTPENRAMLAELFQMEQYVTMALSYARLGNPTKDLVLTRVPLDPVIRQAIRDFAPLLIRKKLRLQYEPTAESALTDSKWLLFILHQLLSNAVKYTERGRVSIRVTSAPAIIVADTGIGIAPEDVPRVFEKGYTGYNGRGGQKSTGLGLYLVHQTAEMLHCRVSLSSRIGEGTSVTIDLHQEELGKERGASMPLLPALRAFFTRLLTDVDDVLFPQHVFCLTCGALSLPNAICPVCLAVLDDLRLPSDALAPNAAAVWGYHGIARQLVLMLKYSGIAECAQVLADGMASACPFALPPDTVVTSVPMTKKHLDARGIDHGRLLAEAFAQRRNLPYQPLLIRTRETATQQGLNAAQRRKNLHGAFAAAARISTPVLLIDDVYTTGSTTETCADALRAAGAPDVFVLTALAVVPDEDH